ncbi:MAG: hydantoinase/oxoprolinase family protein [Pseudomonadales bacterium]|nr:hydantoinase/oxoprolinase family protein [Pseudomonadales bacterium]
MDNPGEQQLDFILGVDTGGTFTDFVLLTPSGLQIHKVLSTPEAPERAILTGIRELGLNEAIAKQQLRITHGSTVATNAALENKGVRTAFVTNHGFADLLSLGRQTRAELYNLTPDLPQQPVPAALCFETGGRLNAKGECIEPLTEAAINQLLEAIQQQQPQAIAINLLFSFLDDTAESRLAEALKPIAYVSRSSQVLPIAGEYERGIATWLNASLGPLVSNYLSRLKNGVSPCHVAVMQSTGGTIDASQAGNNAVNMLLSGPAGGLAGASYIGECQGRHQLLTFDMGGTSTDVALIDGQIKLTNEGRIGPWPVAVPQVDMHTIGAGGGSIAFIDRGGLLQVGPESAGANPGPACYGRGGTEATVTDANAALGKLHPDYFLGGAMPLDLGNATSAVNTLAEKLQLSQEATAQGILDIANEHMARALRVISIERGYSIEQFTLCCFGGAGGLHVCDLADNLGMDTALIPINGGVLSAFGMLTALKTRQLTQALITPLRGVPTSEIDQVIDALTQQGTKSLQEEGVAPESISVTGSVQLRYTGQTFYLEVPWEHDISKAVAAFHDAHKNRFGHQLDIEVELVNVVVALKAPQPMIELPTKTQQAAAEAVIQSDIYLQGKWTRCNVYEREMLASGQAVAGPALIVERVSTTLITHGWRAVVDEWGNLNLDRACS